MPFKSQLFKDKLQSNLSELSRIYICKKNPAYFSPIWPSGISLLFFIVGNKELKKKALGAAFWKALFWGHLYLSIKIYAAYQ